MEIFIGADYRGFALKNELLKWLAQRDDAVTDMGAFSYQEGDDFNDPAVKVALSVRENPGAMGILICGSAHGVTIQANRFLGVRAAHCDDMESAGLAREHDDANILCLSAEKFTTDAAVAIVEKFLKTEFTPLERRVRRINRLDERSDYA